MDTKALNASLMLRIFHALKNIDHYF